MKIYHKPKLTKHAHLKNITFSEPRYDKWDDEGDGGSAVTAGGEG